MKAKLFCCSIILVMVVGCSKHTNNNTPPFAGNWNLIKSVWYIMGGLHPTYPAKDSAVSLILNTNYTYQSKLNNAIVSSGNYSVSPDGQDLNLQNFQATGIFQPLVLSQIDSSGQTASAVFSTFSMSISNDTMTLTPDVMIPAGQEVYFFVKQ